MIHFQEQANEMVTNKTKKQGTQRNEKQTNNCARIDVHVNCNVLASVCYIASSRCAMLDSF